MKRLSIFCVAILLATGAAAQKTYELSSPGGVLKVMVESGENLTYTVEHGGDQLLDKSEVSMTLSDGTVYGGSQKAPKVSRRTVNDVHSTVAYKKSQVEDQPKHL